MKDCLNCLWEKVCDGKSCCEYFTPLNDYDVKAQEYNQNLRERFECYQEIINEFND